MASSNIHVFLAALLLCSHLFAAANLVHRECTHAPKIVSSLNPARCIQLLSADPNAAKATNLKELAIIGLKLAVTTARKALDHINSAAGDSELKSVLNAVSEQVKFVESSFKSALAEVKEDDDFQSANYDCFVVNDYVTQAREELKKAKDNVDVYQTSIDTLGDFGLLNYVLTNDADEYLS